MVHRQEPPLGGQAVEGFHQHIHQNVPQANHPVGFSFFQREPFFIPGRLVFPAGVAFNRRNEQGDSLMLTLTTMQNAPPAVKPKSGLKAAA